MTTPTVLSNSEESMPVYFWREYEEPYGFLSQWFECPFEHEGVTYKTAEMWMMVQKAKLFGDDDVAEQMLVTTEPKEHKALGRKVRNFHRPKWDEHKERIVEEGNWWKFTNNKGVARMIDLLLETDDRELVEASPFDRIWGIGFGAGSACQNRHKWGENLLGKALMKVRDRLREL
ncbi:hypothetical protein BDY21DRAFT_343545 [Lineolata rhizophorae]|uniref:NADAR domain-containing protein n=1 Tax=Lineolata rhizophorae TaxID=578093 RepID=A0A6A6P2G6_9PEZI|nr:hypothetical protein BDY21DRAFT_343545 [Lineolata rhizophorae]